MEPGSGARDRGDRPWPTHGDEGGLSLLELLIAVAVIGIMVAVTLPLLDRGRSQAARDEFVFAHSQTRSVAVQYGTVAELRLDPSAGSYWIQVDTAGTGAYDTLLVRRPAEDRVTMTATRDRLCFDARGLATARGPCDPPDAEVVFSAGGRTDTVATTAGGLVKR